MTLRRAIGRRRTGSRPAVALFLAVLVVWLVSALAHVQRTGAAVQREAPNRYLAVVLDSRPTAYWRLGDRGGKIAADTTGHGYSGTYVGGVELGTLGALVGDVDAAASFDGVNDMVAVPAVSLGVRPSQSFTLELWIKPEGRGARGDTTYGTLLAYDDTHRLLWSTADGRLVTNFHGDFVSKRSASEGKWHHVVYTFDGSRERYYVDALPAGSRAAKRRTWNARFTIGGFDASNYFFRGSIDEVAVYRRALGRAEIQSHYNASLRPRLNREAHPWQQAALYVLAGIVIGYVVAPWWLGLLWSAVGLAGVVTAASEQMFFLLATALLVAALAVRWAAGRSRAGAPLPGRTSAMARWLASLREARSRVRRR